MLNSLEKNLQSEKQSRLQIIKRRGLEGLLFSALSFSALQGCHLIKSELDRKYDEHIQRSAARWPEESLGWLDLNKYLSHKHGDDLVVRVPCNYSGNLHIHDINITFVPETDINSQVYVNGKRCIEDFDHMLSKVAKQATYEAKALLKYGQGTSEEEAKNLHLIQAKVTYTSYSITDRDRDNIFVARTASVSFKGTTGCKGANLPEPFVVHTNTSAGWELLHRVISENAKLRREYEESVSRFVDNNKEEIVRLAREGETDQGSEKPEWWASAWDGSLQEKGLANIKKIAEQGVIPPESLPIPALRNYLNKETYKTLKDIAGSEWKEW